MRKFHIPLLLLFLSTSTNSLAGVVIGGTRLIYQESMKEINITLENQDNTPYLMKSWIESSKKEETNFLVTPPLFRLEGKQKNVLRIFKTGLDLPKDRESLFFLNAMSIPTADSKDANSLQIAIRSRLKLFYRPTSLLDSTPEELTDKLTWEKQGKKLKVTNPTPYYMNFMSVTVSNNKVKDVNFIAPLSTVDFDLPDNISTDEVEWKIINDFGGIGPVHKRKI